MTKQQKVELYNLLSSVQISEIVEEIANYAKRSYTVTSKAYSKDHGYAQLQLALYRIFKRTLEDLEAIV